MITDFYPVAIADLWHAADAARGEGWGGVHIIHYGTQAITGRPLVLLVTSLPLASRFWSIRMPLIFARP
ncbi:hypothetical protein [Paraburkholderia pallida]|uniref:Uncharacterized protein n=1 Tax=Paraburkholderia pallida TaxID=2547399 RepID=A0A4P7D668_9BURK|nr:hypothetical protein [Paraburkholderia pallida]QBR03618.1 hypothetical protein E1956_41645 [Paraburkholderia pallida]